MVVLLLLLLPPQPLLLLWMLMLVLVALAALAGRRWLGGVGLVVVGAWWPSLRGCLVKHDNKGH